MYKRKQHPPPSFLSLSSKSLKTKPASVCGVVPENDENVPENAADILEDTEDAFVIPASQCPDATTQRRYFSQRSNANRSQSSFNPGSSTRRVPSSYFENTLLRCGVTFDNPQYIVLGCDHINFVSKLRIMLESAPDYPENIERFVAGLRDFIKDELELTKMLSVCMINMPNCDFLPQSQDCLMRNFLIIDAMEQKVVELLLDTLASICSETNATDQNICSALLILGQLGFVNKRNNSEQIYTQIVALLGLTEDVFRNEIIKCLPDIVEVRRHDNIVEKIICLMGSDPQKYLNAVTVNSFEALQLSPRLRCLLKTRILTYIQEEDAPVELYPTFAKFLLNCDRSENVVELLTRFRKIDWSVKGNENVSLVHETQKEVFQFILRALKRSKELNEGWLRSICSSGRVEDCFPSDVVVLILMSSINEDRSVYLESVLRRKIKGGWITRDTFTKAIKGFPLVISQHLKVFFEFIDNMFRVKDDLFEFGEIGYKLAFGIPNCDHKLLLSKLIAFVCEKSSDYVVRRALMLLQEISDDYPEEVQKNSLQILRLLDKAHDVGLFEYRLIMDLLSSIAYPPPPALPVEGVASHIDIMVRKQVTGSGNNIRRQGIVGSVRVIDHLVWHADLSSAEGNGGDTETTIYAIEDLPDGNGKTAANAVNLMLLSSENCPQNRALCYDELSSALCPGVRNTKPYQFLDRPFLNWFSEMVTGEFQNIFIVNEVPEVSDVTLAKMFKLNRDDEYTESNVEAMDIAVNIGGLVFTPEYKTRPVVTTLSPTFNVVRILQFHCQNGQLENINALLGCPIIFPHFINTPEELDLQEDPVKSVHIMDILFQTANWFREIICAFSSQRELKIRMKVLGRLADLIDLEQNIRNMLATMPSTYMPPRCQFMTIDTHGVEGHNKKGRPTAGGGKKGHEDTAPVDSIPNNSTLLSGDQTMLQSSSRVEAGKKSVSSAGFYGPRETYRQLDPDILMLLNEALCTSYPLPREKKGTCLGLAEYRFIVEDLILKLESVTGLKKGTAGQQDQFVFSGVSLISDLKSFLARFMHFFDQLCSAIRRNQELGANEYTDKGLYTEEMNLLKRCFGLTLRLLAALFSWQGFHQEKHRPLFKSSLLIVLREEERDTDGGEHRIDDLCKRVSDAMITHQESVLDLYSAVHLYNLVVALSSYTNDYAKSVRLCDAFLKRQWYSHTGAVERGGDANTLLNELLKGLFRNIDFDALKKCIDKTVDDLDGLKGKEGKLKSFPNLNKANLPLLFRALANSVYELTVDRLEKDLTTLMKLQFWERVYEAQNCLLDVVQRVNIPRNFTLFLKYSHLILKLFLQDGMPAVESHLKGNAERVKLLLKSVQKTTRFLHKLCCQSKCVKNAAVIALIPGLRQSVESFTYSVKAALVANKCSDAFLLGNLKNNDLQGEIILSQVVSLSDGQGASDDDEDLGVSDDETEVGVSYLGITTMCHKSPAVPGSSKRRTTRNRK